MSRKQIFETGCIVEKNSVGLIIERPVVNIDSPFDLELAEWLIAKREKYDDFYWRYVQI